jgi:hypothetical protein
LKTIVQEGLADLAASDPTIQAAFDAFPVFAAAILRVEQIQSQAN